MLPVDKHKVFDQVNLNTTLNNSLNTSSKMTNVGRCPIWTDEAFDDFYFLFATYVRLNDIEEGKQVDLLLNAMGAKGLRIRKLQSKSKEVDSGRDQGSRK